MNNKSRKHESGQALIIITFAIIGLIAMTGLTVDGGMAYADHRHAQNAADSAAYAAALNHARNPEGTPYSNLTAAARAIASQNGYDNNGDSNTVDVDVCPNSTKCPAPITGCPAGTNPADNIEITVTIKSKVATTFGNVIGIRQMNSTVFATTRACGIVIKPLFDGFPIVSLAPNGTGFDSGGNTSVTITSDTGGGILSNSGDGDSIECTGSAGFSAPSISTVGEVNMDQDCLDGITGSVQENTPSSITWDDYKDLLPPTPDCSLNAVCAGGHCSPNPGVDPNGEEGSAVNLTDQDWTFDPGVYCITASFPGNTFNSTITGTDVTFYIADSNFIMKLAGEGTGFEANAPDNGPYAGVLIYVEPSVDANGNLINTGSIDMRGNGNVDSVGTVIAPSADITLYGNSNQDAKLNSQVIGYQIETGGSSELQVAYNSGNNYKPVYPVSISLLK